MLTDDIDIVSENLTNRLDNILRYSDFGKLSENIGYLSGSLTLEKINQEIVNKRQVRYAVLKQLYDDITNKLIKYHIQNFKIYLDPRQIYNEDYLNLQLVINNTTIKPFINQSGVQSHYNSYIDGTLDLMFPYLKSLLDYKNTNSLLDNDFYNDLLVNLAGTRLISLKLNGDGISIVINNQRLSENKYVITSLEKHFQEHYEEILSKISVYNNESLDKYRTNLNKRKALAIYKRGIK